MDWFDITLRWYLITTVVTIGLAPIALLFGPKTRDWGAFMARPVAMIAFLWPAWFISALGFVPYAATTLWITTAAVAVAAWALAWRAGVLRVRVFGHIAAAEVAHLLAFSLFLWFRGFGPDANFQEKPSDLMMLASTMHSSSVPPTDAWLAGEPVNYYYLGYALWGGFGKMAGAAPAEAYTLALVSTAALTLSIVIGTVANVLAHWYSDLVARIGGLTAGIFTLMLGTPWAASTVLGDPSGQWSLEDSDPIGFFNGVAWQASRIIIDNPDGGANPITEFPAFSFILGDLHPHLIALPFTVLALAGAWVLLILGRLKPDESLLVRDGWRIAFAGLIAGGLYAMNSWDFPTYLLIMMLALLAGTVGAPVRDRVIAYCILIGASILAWSPFYVAFEAPARTTGTPFSDWISGVPVLGGVLGSIAAYEGPRTSPQDYFAIFGYMYLVALVLIVVETWRRRDGVMLARAEARGGAWERDPVTQWVAIGSAILCFVGSLVVPAPLLVICGLPVIVVWLLLERDTRLTPANIALVLYAIAMIMTLVPEFFYISDYYSTRMNTVFKITYQAWVLMGVATGLAAISIWKSLRHDLIARFGLPVALAGIIALGATYPVVAGKQWLDWRAPDRAWVGVDGLAYLLDDARYAGEYGAIAWLIEHADEDDVILTAGGGEWANEIGRVSSGSGVSTIMGWTGHENQWHLGDANFRDEASQRIADIEALYSVPPSPEALDRYGVTLIYIGPTETSGIGAEPSAGYYAPGPFEAASDPAFPGEGWTEVYNEGGSRIYQRDGS